MKKRVPARIKLSVVNFVLTEPLNLGKLKQETPDFTAFPAGKLLDQKENPPFAFLTLWNLPS